MSKCDSNKVAKELYWIRTSAWVFSCTFAAYFQNNFFKEHLWVAAYARRLYKLEKQPPGRVLPNSCFEKFKEVDFRENIRGSIFFLVLLSKIFYHKCFLRNISKYFRTATLKNTSGRLLLKLSRKLMVAVFFSTEAAIHKSCNKVSKKFAYQVFVK